MNNYRYSRATMRGAREENEDASCILVHPNVDILILADGMGGHGMGAEAAQAAVAAVRAAYEEEAQQHEIGRPSIFTKEPEDCTTWALATIRRASRAVVEMGELAGYRDGGRGFPGTTLTFALAWKGRVLVAAVGDSPAFISGEQITRGHRAPGPLNVLTSAIPHVHAVELHLVDVSLGAPIVLTSDGVNPEIVQRRAARIDAASLIRQQHREAAPKQDNATAVVRTYEHGAAQSGQVACRVINPT